MEIRLHEREATIKLRQLHIKGSGNTCRSLQEFNFIKRRNNFQIMYKGIKSFCGALVMFFKGKSGNSVFCRESRIKSVTHIKKG